MASRNNDDPSLGWAYEILEDAKKMTDEAREWIRETQESIGRVKAKSKKLGVPVITANQVIPIGLRGRKHFVKLLGYALTLLFEGSVTIKFRKT